MWGLTINDKHTFDDFGLCCLSCTLDPPEPRLYTIDIPGADGVLDATAARGRVTYKNRTLTAEFDCVYESRTSYDAACAALNTAHHGRLVELLTDSDPQHVLTGRAAWEHTVDGLAATHTLTVDCQPYRMALSPTEKTYVLTGEELPIALLNAQKAVIPEFVTDAAGMTVKTASGTQYTVMKTGGYTIPEIYLSEGVNIFTLNGTGTMTIRYREGVL